jgi:alkaline phosphatase D
MNKRSFIYLLSSSALVSACGSLAAKSLRHNPFLLGVASGSPSLDGFVLWTRLLAPPHGDPLPASPIEVGWELASDPEFRRVVQSGRVLALPEEAHSVHIEVAGLPPVAQDSPAPIYWYRFQAGQALSTVGKTSALPSPLSQQPLRLALASCQNYEHGFFGAYQHMSKEALDLVLFVGDYIYEYGPTPGRTRQHDSGVCYNLTDYRNRYALYKSDSDLQAAHAAFPWIVTWDDHEVANDYANDRSATEGGADFLARRAAAYRAYWEHQPLRRSLMPQYERMPLYRKYRWGKIANLHVLDARQYRDPQVCTPANQGGSRSITDENCPTRKHAPLSLLGQQQENWLEQNLERSDAAFDIIGQQSIMAQMRMFASRSTQDHNANTFWNDSWDGYPVARQRALNSWGRNKNVITLGGDVHATYLSDLKANFDDPSSPTLASEIVGTSISSPSWSQATTELVMAHNPHMKFGKSDQRGYATLEVGHRHTQVTLRVIDNARIENPLVSTAGKFVIDRKRPGIQRA